MDMKLLMDKLREGEGHSTLMLANEMHTTVEDVQRTLEYLERIGVLKKTELGKFECGGNCSSCSGCSSHSRNSGKKGPCKGCLPENGFNTMGVIWQVQPEA